MPRLSELASSLIEPWRPTMRHLPLKVTPVKHSLPAIDQLPATGYVREKQLLGRPGRPGPLPFSHATLWRLVRERQFPAPVKLSVGITAFCVEEVRAWMEARK